MSSAHKLADRAKADRTLKRKVSSDEDQMDDDEEEQTSYSDSEVPLIQAVQDKDRRAEKLLKLERDKKTEEALDKSLAEQKARNAKK